MIISVLLMAIQGQRKFLTTLIDGGFKYFISISFISLTQPRIAIVAPFSGLRRFPNGVRFKQWTGNDSKALMKVGDVHMLKWLRLYSLKPLPIGLFAGN
jgi:hypothetical protein